ncbi:protein YceG like [Streptococcus mitis]|uniref:Protein YceG like n=1 Tax=Streptococcus mitis TaxID=28037 RepID=A0A150NKP2_STRMT|nr:protein YceG like [Streptococcus mitis]
MSEKSREDEKLSFKEQILRDLEKVKRYEGIRQEAAELDEKNQLCLSLTQKLLMKK